MTPPELWVDLIVVDCDLEALALRAALEWWGVQVTLHLVGMAKDVVHILSGQERLSEYIVLSCHGDERGLILPELCPEIEHEQPYHGRLSASDLCEFLALPGKVVVNTGCALGGPEFADAFLEAGASAYIGAVDYPNGSSALFYALYLFYELVYHKASLEEAHEKAHSHDNGTQCFRLYQRSARSKTSQV